MSLGLDCKRLARDTAREEYVALRDSGATTAIKVKARTAYMLAQSEYSAALLAAKKGSRTP